MIHTSTCVTGWLPASDTGVGPWPRVTSASCVVSGNSASAEGADRTCTTVPGLGESMVSSDSCTADANDTMIPTPGLSAGNCCL